MANTQVLFFDMSAAQTVTPWFRLLRTDTDHERAIHGTTATGDSVVVQLTNENLNTERNVMQTDVSTSSYAASDSQTANVFNLTYKGAFKWVRILKTGSNGVARVVVEG